MKVVIPGGTGQVGTVLARAFHNDGHEVVVLGRHVTTLPWRFVHWDGEAIGEWASEIDGADVVINLAGRSVNCRYNAENRRQMMDSRVNSTRVVGEAIHLAPRPPKVWLQASTATIYAHRFDAPNDELTGVIGGAEPGAPGYWRNSVDIAQAWERTLVDAHTPATRKVALRTAMVMDPQPGVLVDVQHGLTRWGLGGPIAGGRQFVSWIHEHDFARAVAFLLEHDDLEGAVNVAAPGPLPQREFMAALRAAWGAPVGLPATKWMVEVGAL